MARKPSIEVPHSRVKMAVAKILSEEGYVGEVSSVEGKPSGMIRIAMRYSGDAPVITGVKRMSKPGLRVYVNRSVIPVVVGGMGIAIVSTPQGIMTGQAARKKGIGGELLCTIW